MKQNVSDEFVDFLAEGADIVIELAEGIPVVGAAVKAAKVYGSIRDRLFMRQVEGFVRELDKISGEDRDAFIGHLEDRGELQRFGETVILVLSQLDDFEKSTIIGRLYSAAIRGSIDLQDAERVSAMVSRVFVSDLSILKIFKERVFTEDDTIVHGLAAIGLLRVSQPQQSAFAVLGENHGAYYILSEYGTILMEYGLA